jgi:hypothetical protein
VVLIIMNRQHSKCSLSLCPGNKTIDIQDAHKPTVRVCTYMRDLCCLRLLRAFAFPLWIYFTGAQLKWDGVRSHSQSVQFSASNTKIGGLSFFFILRSDEFAFYLEKHTQLSRARSGCLQSPIEKFSCR